MPGCFATSHVFCDRPTEQPAIYFTPAPAEQAKSTAVDWSDIDSLPIELRIVYEQAKAMQIATEKRLRVYPVGQYWYAQPAEPVDIATGYGATPEAAILAYAAFMREREEHAETPILGDERARELWRNVSINMPYDNERTKELDQWASRGDNKDAP